MPFSPFSFHFLADRYKCVLFCEGGGGEGKEKEEEEEVRGERGSGGWAGGRSSSQSLRTHPGNSAAVGLAPRRCADVSNSTEAIDDRQPTEEDVVSSPTAHRPAPSPSRSPLPRPSSRRYGQLQRGRPVLHRTGRQLRRPEDAAKRHHRRPTRHPVLLRPRLSQAQRLLSRLSPNMRR